MIFLLATALALDPAAIREGVSSDRLDADLRALTGDVPLADGTHLTSRSVAHPQVVQAEAWLLDAFSAIEGLEVARQPFDYAGPYPLANVVAELPGAQPTLPPVLVMAHYDSTASQDEGWDATTDPAPGADDDASGITSILEIARVMASWEPGFSRTIRFVAFSAEEVGLVGSTAYVAALDGTVEMAYALDPVGHNPGGSGVLWFSYDARWPEETAALEALADELDVLEVTGVDAALIGGDERSDHFPFWQAGWPAVHVGTFPLPPSYHTAEDTLDVVDLAFLTEVTVFIATRVSAVAEPLPAEEVRSCGCSQANPSILWLFALAPLLRRRP